MGGLPVRALLRARGIVPRKRLGQHFLADEAVVARILTLAEVGPADVVLEIGAGLGALTEELADRAGHLVALEVDPRLVAYLREQFGGRPHVEVVQADILAFDLASLARRFQTRLTVVANLPYGIGTEVVFRLLEHRRGFSRLVLMLQKEVAERIVAAPGTKAYGILSILTRLYADVRLGPRVPRRLFVPVPEVDSAVVRFDLLEHPRVDADEEQLRAVVRAALGKRRKTLWNALRSSPAITAGPEALARGLARAGVDGGRRGETLSLEEFANLTQALGKEA
ncbi:MAG: 16S rRNA (adenine(1518)-N(6)/adenine(1519)-N(6))-dimethyltransferase RsmA [Deltaproteobacteria bacterium]|nr:16S rRNA (adenine(1518)-N(6)/adenine(1519)-N(6))-dimethyltransferase RsmA [Deltaproteobacteria bacterium]